ncbi:MAG TPA: 50S ribosomal protein L11 methyltransferase [Anaerolineaceae bacterium]|nr:50S ribosomal protein L11 methyltransferase [Anaerolineaceae bacterium]
MADAKWMEVSLTVDGELAESVAEVISRFTNEGVVMERAVEYNDAEDEGTPYGPVRVSGYLLVGPSLEESRQRLEEAFWHLGQIQPLPKPVYRPIEDQDWMESWKKYYHPIRIGQRLLVLPAWMENPDPGRVVVKIDPSMAFGTGTHPTTQLCLELIESHTPAGEPVIDVGCGSGILSIAAVKMGAGRVVAVDIDEAAIRSTRENAAANGVLESIETGIGSVQELRDSRFSLQRAPLVLANILAPVIIRLFDLGLADLVIPGGEIILSGILAGQVESVDEAATRHHLKLVERKYINDWAALVYRRLP